MDRDQIMTEALDQQSEILNSGDRERLMDATSATLLHIAKGVDDPKRLEVLKGTWANQAGSVHYETMSDDELRGFLKGLFWVRNECDWVDLPVPA